MAQTLLSLCSVSSWPSDLFPILSRKEVFQPHLPVRLPCYDLAPITGLTLGRSSPRPGNVFTAPWLMRDY